eukprot:2042464-Lingulodinium_polyedra.AAC.1
MTMRSSIWAPRYAFAHQRMRQKRPFCIFPMPVELAAVSIGEIKIYGEEFVDYYSGNNRWMSVQCYMSQTHARQS